MLEPAVAEIEAHVHGAGWDRGPVLFALVRAEQFRADDPATAARLGIDRQPAQALTPVEQDLLPDGPLDAALAGIVWPDSVAGCALSQEIVLLPPSAEASLPVEQDDAELARRSVAHPDRREARLVVGVLRDGTSAALLRLRGRADSGDGQHQTDDLLTGPDLAPNLVAALLATFA